MATRKLESVDLTFSFNDGTTIKASINVEEGYWHQWGASTRELGDNVDRLYAIQDAVRE